MAMRIMKSAQIPMNQRASSSLKTRFQFRRNMTTNSRKLRLPKVMKKMSHSSISQEFPHCV